MAKTAINAFKRLLGRSRDGHNAKRRHRNCSRQLQAERLEERCMLSQTVGVFVNKAEAFEGYTLLAPSTNDRTYLIDNQGQMVNSWLSNYPPMTSYLLEDGDLLRAARLPNPTMNAAGASGRIERFSWDGELEWSYTLKNYSHQLHHDFEMMPNGNILMIAWERKTRADAIAEGRDPNLLPGSGELWVDMVIEVQPYKNADGGKIVWEWHLWDHMVQNRFPNKPNYRPVLSNNPQLVDINFESAGEPGAADVPEDWTHANGIDYNAELDQIVLSVRDFSEMWVVDHSTTTAQARGHTGGDSGKGGDLLYRWGNPRTYGAGTKADQMMWYQHDTEWVPEGYPGAGNITVLDNGVGRPGADHSAVLEIVPPLQADGNYTIGPGKAYGPINVHWSYTAPNKPDFFSSIISGAIRLPNGNTLIDEGTKGKIFEVTPAGEKVWVYVNPVIRTGPLHQGDPIPPSGFLGTRDNLVFRAHRYGPDYPGLAGRTLYPGRTIELNPGDTAGLFVPTANTWYLNNRSDGSINDLIAFDAPNVPSSWTPVAGNWDAVGGDTVGLYAPATGTWYLNNKVDGSVTDLIIINGPVRPNWKPVAGDWDGDGIDTVGLYVPSTNTWHLNNAPDGWTDVVIVQGPQHNQPSWRPIAGDWNGDGVDTIGLYDPSQNTWYLNNKIDGTFKPNGIDAKIVNGPQHNAPWRIPIAGDWELDGRDSIGLYDQYSNTWYLNRKNVGSQKHVISFKGPSVPSSWKPIVGNWNGSVLPGTPPAGGEGEARPEGEADAALLASEFMSAAGGLHAGLDVNQDGDVSPLDVLTVVNVLARTGPISVTAAAKLEDVQYWLADVNGDGVISPFDVLQLVDHLNQPVLDQPVVLPVDTYMAETESRRDVAVVEEIPDDESELVDDIPAVDSKAAAVTSLRVSTRHNGTEERLDDILDDVVVDIAESWGI